MDQICPKIGIPCKYCSNEITRIVKRTGDIVTGIKRTTTEIPHGLFCNNDGRTYVKDLLVCPIPGALRVPLMPFEVDPVTWLKMRGEVKDDK